MTATYLGIDCGTQGTKTLAITADGTACGRGYAPHQLIERPSGAREQEPAWWVAALRTSLCAALATTPAAAVQAIGVSGQQHGLVVLDADHNVIRPAKLWNDTETAEANQKLIDHFGGEQAWLQRFGIVPRTGYTVSKLLWLAEHEAANFARIRHILLPHEYLNFWLTGELAAEAGDASGTGYFNPKNRTWLPEVLAFIDGGTGQLERALPRLITVDEAVGTVRPALCEEFGLSSSCIVSAGGGDNMMGAIGTGNVREGIVTLGIGTSGTVYSFRAAPSTDTTGWVAPFCASSGGWLPLICTMNATNVVTQTLTTLGRSVDDIESTLAATVPGADGLTLLPFFNGERTPDLPTARGTLTGISATNFTPDHLIRAAIEGVSFGILDGLDRITEGVAADRIRVIGGGARSSAWRQLLADASGAQVEVPVEEEAGCLGAALQALYLDCHSQGAAVTFDALAATAVRLQQAIATPDPSRAAAYAAARSRYFQQLNALYSVDSGPSCAR